MAREVRPLRVLYLITDLAKGGAERFLVDLATALRLRDDVDFKIGSLYERDLYGALTDGNLISGNLDLYCPALSGALPQIQAKTIKFFGVLTDQRSPLLPDLPTAAEQGLPGINGNYWLGLFAPVGTPEPIVAKLRQAAMSALETPDVVSRLREVGAAVVAPERRTPAYLKKYVSEEIASWAKIIKDSGVAPKM